MVKTSCKLLLLVFLVGCSAGDVTALLPGQTIETIAAKEACDLIEDNAGNEDFVILDVRTSAEYETSRIEGAINIDFYDTDFGATVQQLDKASTYLIYCRSGNRSSQAQQLMAQQEFMATYNLNDGMNSWSTTKTTCNP